MKALKVNMYALNLKENEIWKAPINSIRKISNRRKSNYINKQSKALSPNVDRRSLKPSVSPPSLKPSVCPP